MILYIETMGENDELSLQDLSYKVVMLLTLTRPCRSADLEGLDLRFRRYFPKGKDIKSSLRNILTNSLKCCTVKHSHFQPPKAKMHVLGSNAGLS